MSISSPKTTIEAKQRVALEIERRFKLQKEVERAVTEALREARRVERDAHAECEMWRRRAEVAEARIEELRGINRTARQSTRHPESPQMSTIQRSADLLRGAAAIAQHLGMTEKAARHKIEAKIIPTFRIPGDSTICARRSSLDCFLRDCESGMEAS